MNQNKNLELLKKLQKLPLQREPIHPELKLDKFPRKPSTKVCLPYINDTGMVANSNDDGNKLWPSSMQSQGRDQLMQEQEREMQYSRVGQEYEVVQNRRQEYITVDNVRPGYKTYDSMDCSDYSSVDRSGYETVDNGNVTGEAREIRTLKGLMSSEDERREEEYFRSLAPGEVFNFGSPFSIFEQLRRKEELERARSKERIEMEEENQQSNNKLAEQTSNSELANETDQFLTSFNQKFISNNKSQQNIVQSPRKSTQSPRKKSKYLIEWVPPKQQQRRKALGIQDKYQKYEDQEEDHEERVDVSRFGIDRDLMKRWEEMRNDDNSNGKEGVRRVDIEDAQSIRDARVKDLPLPLPIEQKQESTLSQAMSKFRTRDSLMREDYPYFVPTNIYEQRIVEEDSFLESSSSVLEYFEPRRGPVIWAVENRTSILGVGLLDRDEGKEENEAGVEVRQVMEDNSEQKINQMGESNEQIVESLLKEPSNMREDNKSQIKENSQEPSKIIKSAQKSVIIKSSLIEEDKPIIQDYQFSVITVQQVQQEQSVEQQAEQSQSQDNNNNNNRTVDPTDDDEVLTAKSCYMRTDSKDSFIIIHDQPNGDSQSEHEQIQYEEYDQHRGQRQQSSVGQHSLDDEDGDDEEDEDGEEDGEFYQQQRKSQIYEHEREHLQQYAEDQAYQPYFGQQYHPTSSFHRQFTPESSQQHMNRFNNSFQSPQPGSINPPFSSYYHQNLSGQYNYPGNYQPNSQAHYQRTHLDQGHVRNIPHHNNSQIEFYNYHMQRLDNMMLKIMDMKRDFQNYYLAHINSQSQQTESTNLLILQKIDSLQNMFARTLPKFQFMCNHQQQNNSNHHYSNYNINNRYPNYDSIPQFMSNQVIQSSRQSMSNDQPQQQYQDYAMLNSINCNFSHLSNFKNTISINKPSGKNSHGENKRKSNFKSMLNQGSSRKTGELGLDTRKSNKNHQSQSQRRSVQSNSQDENMNIHQQQNYHNQNSNSQHSSQNQNHINHKHSRHNSLSSSALVSLENHPTQNILSVSSFNNALIRNTLSNRDNQNNSNNQKNFKKPNKFSSISTKLIKDHPIDPLNPNANTISYSTKLIEEVQLTFNKNRQHRKRKPVEDKEKLQKNQKKFKKYREDIDKDLKLIEQKQRQEIEAQSNSNSKEQNGGQIQQNKNEMLASLPLITKVISNKQQLQKAIKFIQSDLNPNNANESTLSQIINGQHPLPLQLLNDLGNQLNNKQQSFKLIQKGDIYNSINDFSAKDSFWKSSLLNSNSKSVHSNELSTIPNSNETHLLFNQSVLISFGPQQSVRNPNDITMIKSKSDCFNLLSSKSQDESKILSQGSQELPKFILLNDNSKNKNQSQSKSSQKEESILLSEKNPQKKDQSILISEDKSQNSEQKDEHMLLSQGKSQKKSEDQKLMPIQKFPQKSEEMLLFGDKSDKKSDSMLFSGQKSKKSQNKSDKKSDQMLLSGEQSKQSEMKSDKKSDSMLLSEGDQKKSEDKSDSMLLSEEKSKIKSQKKSDSMLLSGDKSKVSSKKQDEMLLSSQKSQEKQENKSLSKQLHRRQNSLGLSSERSSSKNKKKVQFFIPSQSPENITTNSKGMLNYSLSSSKSSAKFNNDQSQNNEKFQEKRYVRVMVNSRDESFGLDNSEGRNGRMREEYSYEVEISRDGSSLIADRKGNDGLVETAPVGFFVQKVMDEMEQSAESKRESHSSVSKESESNNSSSNNESHRTFEINTTRVVESNKCLSSEKEVSLIDSLIRVEREGIQSEEIQMEEKIPEAKAEIKQQQVLNEQILQRIQDEHDTAFLLGSNGTESEDHPIQEADENVTEYLLEKSFIFKPPGAEPKFKGKKVIEIIETYIQKSDSDSYFATVKPPKAKKGSNKNDKIDEEKKKHKQELLKQGIIQHDIPVISFNKKLKQGHYCKGETKTIPFNAEKTYQIDPNNSSTSSKGVPSQTIDSHNTSQDKSNINESSDENSSSKGRSEKFGSEKGGESSCQVNGRERKYSFGLRQNDKTGTQSVTLKNQFVRLIPVEEESLNKQVQKEQAAIQSVDEPHTKYVEKEFYSKSNEKQPTNKSIENEPVIAEYRPSKLDELRSKLYPEARQVAQMYEIGYQRNTVEVTEDDSRIFTSVYYNNMNKKMLGYSWCKFRQLSN